MIDASCREEVIRMAGNLKRRLAVLELALHGACSLVPDSDDDIKMGLLKSFSDVKTAVRECKDCPYRKSCEHKNEA